MGRVAHHYRPLLDLRCRRAPRGLSRRHPRERIRLHRPHPLLQRYSLTHLFAHPLFTRFPIPLKEILNFHSFLLLLLFYYCSHNSLTLTILLTTVHTVYTKYTYEYITHEEHRTVSNCKLPNLLIFIWS